MKLVLLILFLIVPNIVFCQCSYRRNEVDEFTGNKILVTTPKLLLNKFGGHSFICHTGKIDSTIVLYMNFTAWDIFSISRGSKILFKLTNDSICGLLAANEYETASSRNMTYVPNWEITIYSVLDEETINTLTMYGVKKCRVYTNDGYLEFEFNPNKTMIIKELIDCVL